MQKPTINQTTIHDQTKLNNQHLMITSKSPIPALNSTKLENPKKQNKRLKLYRGAVTRMIETTPRAIPTKPSSQIEYTISLVRSFRVSCFSFCFFFSTTTQPQLPCRLCNIQTSQKETHFTNQIIPN